MVGLLSPGQAPITVNNFLRYVVSGLRIQVSITVVRADNQLKDKIKIDVIQGGLQEDGHPQMLHPLLMKPPNQA